MIDRTKRCRHFNGFSSGRCKAPEPINYFDVRDATCSPAKFACFGEIEGCGQYSPYTKEEVDAQDAERKRCSACFSRGVSACCEAPLDESHVIQTGRYKGHGSRFCSKCRKVQFTV